MESSWTTNYLQQQYNNSYIDERNISNYLEMCLKIVGKPSEFVTKLL